MWCLPAEIIFPNRRKRLLNQSAAIIIHISNQCSKSYKSYYRRFTAIKFAKPSWRAPQSMIPFIANPTIYVEKYRTARIYSPWRFLPPRNTPDLFCRCFTRQNFSLVLQGGSFLLWDRNYKPFNKPWQGGDPKRDLSRQFVSQRQIPRGCPSCPWPRLANLWKIFLLRCQDDGRPAVQMWAPDAPWNQMPVRLTTLLQPWRSFSHHSEVCPPSQGHSSWKLARCSAGEHKKPWNVHGISWWNRQHWARTAFYFIVALLRCCWMVCTPQWTFLPLPLPCISRNNSRRQGNCVSSWA